MFQAMGVRKARLFIAVVYHTTIVGAGFIVIKIGGLMNSMGLVKMAVLLLLFDLITFRVIPVCRLIEERLIREAVCPGCGLIIELIGIYKCSCGFISHRERHVFSPCPHCRRFFLWLTCPACETSIPL